MKQRLLGRLAGLLCLLLSSTAGNGEERPAGVPRPKCERGEFGGDLIFLRRHHTAPRAPGESNHFFDLWSGTTLPLMARLNGLTNNRALFIDSHGRGDASPSRNRYAYYPHRDLWKGKQKPPQFSARDLAQVIGPATSEIHNIFVGGCNAQRAFDPLELRRYFANATNIVHSVAGQDGFKSMFYSAIVNPSSMNYARYALPNRDSGGHSAYYLLDAPFENAIRIEPYMACLFRPGESQPYRTQVAGRELLDPKTLVKPKSASSPGKSRLSQDGWVIHTIGILHRD